jgi:hypothetical protein
VHAEELSERGIQRGVEAGHTYVKLWGNDGPDLRFSAAGRPAIMGDTVHADPTEVVTFNAKVLNMDEARAARPGDYELFILRNGLPYLAVPIPPIGDEFEFPFPSAGPPARYRLQVQRNTSIEAVSSPIYVEPLDGYARPKSATPVNIRLVPAFEECTSADAAHGAPLAVPSCNPPEPASDHLTVGTPDSNGRPAGFTGDIQLKVVGESPIDPENGDQADVEIRASLADVRRRSDLFDYTGELQALLTLRITDRHNGGDNDDPATSTDVPFAFTVPCAATAGPEGASCSVTTSADGVTAGVVRESRRAVWELDQVRVLDGGADGNAETPDNTLFAVQGTFTP